MINDTLPCKQEVFGSLAAYVMQDDVLYSSFTPREALTFAARLKLPGTNKEQDEYIAKQREIMAMDAGRRASQQEYVDTIMLGVDALSLQQAALEKLQEMIPALKDLRLPDDRERILDIVSTYQDYLTIQDKIKVAQDRVQEKQKFLLENEEDYQDLQKKGFDNLDLYEMKRVDEYNNAILELADRKRNLQSLNKEELKLIQTLGISRAEIDKRKKAEEEEKQRKKASESKRQIVLRNRTAYV
jgi:hypothetical protein